ncbi:MAG: LOG family protein [Pseudomonadales bacterium]|nr:LOG family protein [Pseudomonadales bacterium]
MQNATNKVSASISPENNLNILSPLEINALLAKRGTALYETFRRCALAVLNCGNLEDDTKKVLDAYADFEINVIQQSRGVKLELLNAPPDAFVDGTIITGIKEHLFATLRDIVYVDSVLNQSSRINWNTQEGTTDSVFRLLRHANVLRAGEQPNLVVCWGGHSISRKEYDYTKEVGYQMGLRGLNIVTGCGPGAMKGPMKGATIAHAKQHLKEGRYLGLTEPSIVASEPPNPIVNELVILPDIEKRLEAFVRVGHGIVVFPGGAGTAEEILYLLGVLLHPKNIDIPFPLVFTAPASSGEYFKHIDRFIHDTLGEEAQSKYQIIIGDPQEVALTMKREITTVEDYRRKHKDAYHFNWLLEIPRDFQQPFEPSHENMSALELKADIHTFALAANLRRAFSGIVAGNVKESGLKAIEEYGPYQIKGDLAIMTCLDDLLRSFVQQGRMKLGTGAYTPCYQVIRH